MVNRIKYLREEILCLSQKEFGKKLQLTDAAISNYENGKRKIDNATLLLISKVFNVNLEWLKEGTGAILNNINTISTHFSKPNELIDKINKLDEKEKLLVSAYIDGLIANRPADTNKAKEA